MFGDLAQIILLLVVLFVAYPFRQTLIDAGSWLAARTFLIGVMTFFVSRVIAFFGCGARKTGCTGISYNALMRVPAAAPYRGNNRPS